MPVWLGMWANPGDIIPLLKGGKNVHWLVLGGDIVNWTGGTVHVAGLHVTVLTPGGTIVAERECNYDFRKHQYPDWPAEPQSPTSHGELVDPYTVFVDGIEIPAAVDVSAGLTVRLVFNYKLPDGWCGSTARIDHADYLETPLMLSPVRGSWRFGNGMTQIGFSPHAHFHERYSYDLTQHDANGVTFSGPDDDNNSFFCYGEKIHAMADGVVLGCNWTAAENHGHVDRRGRCFELRDPRPRRRACVSAPLTLRAPPAEGSRQPEQPGEPARRWRHRSGRRRRRLPREQR